MTLAFGIHHGVWGGAMFLSGTVKRSLLLDVAEGGNRDSISSDDWVFGWLFCCLRSNCIRGQLREVILQPRGPLLFQKRTTRRDRTSCLLVSAKSTSCRLRYMFSNCWDSRRLNSQSASWVRNWRSSRCRMGGGGSGKINFRIFWGSSESMLVGYDQIGIWFVI